MDSAMLTEKLSQLTAPRITLEYMRSRIKDTRYLRDGLTTICMIELDNGFKTIGVSTPASPENFREDIGQHYAEEDAFKQLWPLFGFMLVETQYRNCDQPVPERESQP